MNPETYKEAAEENLASAAFLMEGGHYPAAFYLAGVAVECILRAYRLRFDPTFDARHDLVALQIAARFIISMPEEVQKSLVKDLSSVSARWSNNHRFRSRTLLRIFLNDAGLYRIDGQRTIRGDVVAFNGRILLEAATRLVQRGVNSWQS